MSFELDGYVDVPARIRAFAEKYPEGSLSSDWTVVTLGDKTYIVVKAVANRYPNDPNPGVGHAAELYPGKTPYTRDSELMNAETSAWGRAIQALGFDFGKVASTEEVKAARARQSAFEKAVEAPQEPANTWPADVFPSAPEDDPEAPYCVHGSMKNRSGEKNGKAWSGWFCPAPKDEQCAPIWGK